MTFRRAALVATFGALAGAPGGVSAQRPDIVEITIDEAHAAMRAGDLRCRDLVQGYLDRIEAYDQQGPLLNAIQALNPRALALADSLDAVLASGAEMGPLHCVPVLVKDQIETTDMPTTFGSALFDEWVSDRDATSVTRMREAGGIILAKTTMGEFAYHYVGSAFGITRNAYDPRRNPSGSSSGTGAGLAANFGLVGIGEDTSGSNRGPAAAGNLVGLRPTLQLVSRYGMMPYSPTYDTMGPMARNVRDAALLLDVIAGYDPNDPITAYAASKVPDTYTERLDPGALSGARIGILRMTSAHYDPDPDGTRRPGYQAVRELTNAAYATLEALGATVLDSLEIEDLDQLAGIDNPFETEAAIDGYLASLVAPPVASVKDIVLSGVVHPWRNQKFWPVIGKTTDDPEYLGVVHSREALRVSVLEAMADHDLDAIVYPTFDCPPTLIAADVLTNPEPDDGYFTCSNTFLSPTIGFPALTVPAGFTPDALPVGLEFMARPFTEAMLLGFGYAYEKATKHRSPAPTAPPLGP